MKYIDVVLHPLSRMTPRKEVKAECQVFPCHFVAKYRWCELMIHILLYSYWISQMIRSLARVLLEDMWWESQKFYVDELLDWSQNDGLPISYEDAYQKVNSSVWNAVNSQVGKMTTSEDNQAASLPGLGILCNGFIY